jgi:hypothetical protein
MGDRNRITWNTRVRWRLVLPFTLVASMLAAMPCSQALASSPTRVQLTADASAAGRLRDATPGWVLDYAVTVSRGGRHLTVSGHTSAVRASWVAPDPDTRTA